MDYFNTLRQKTIGTPSAVHTIKNYLKTLVIFCQLERKITKSVFYCKMVKLTDIYCCEIVIIILNFKL